MTTKLRTQHHSEACREASALAVKQVFAIMGVDVDRPESIEEFRADLRFAKKIRKASDHMFLVLVGLLAAATMAAVWAGVATKVKGSLK